MKALSAILTCLLLACSTQGQLIVGFDTTRGGSYNLQSQTGAQAAFSAALPSASFSYVSVLSSATLSGASGVIIMSAFNNSNPVTPLTTPEQAALSAFVASGGFAIIVTDSDYVPTLFDVTNDSFLAPFGFGANGAHGAPITVTSPSSHAITNGPFGLINSLSGVAAGSYSGPPSSFVSLGTTPSNDVALGYIAAGSLSANSGAVLFVADSNVFNISVGGSAANYNLISNFVAFAAIPEPTTISLMIAGVGGLGGLALRKRRQPRRD